jgi:hypothetical protein
MANGHTQEELRIFEQFACAAGFEAPLGSFEKRNPPEPDILFRDAGEVLRAFELVRLIDEDYARGVKLLFGTDNALRTFLKDLPVERRVMFEQKYGNASLIVRFSEHSTLNERRRSFSGLFDSLLALNDGLRGEILERHPKFAWPLEGVSIYRGDYQGPRLQSLSSAALAKSPIRKIAKKFQKNYSTTHPIELLVYIEYATIPDNVWLDALTVFLDSRSKPLPFKSLWVFDVHERVVKFRR